MSQRAVGSISGRLSLRAPQRQSLEILHRVMEIARPKKGSDPKKILSAIRAEFKSVEDFSRAFPNLCFALATGVGKTRLMGAFISYLFTEHGIRHFFVLAPNLTIYNKLIADFTPNTPKYVFQGIAEFAVKSPTIVTGENFEEKPQALDLFERDDVVVNVFNISKFSTRTKDSRKMRRLSEFLGQSYFDHLASLDDLVLIMDEAHRYRADASMESIDELKPILGLELTATPHVERGTKTERFRNVIFDYPLSQAMTDGFVKEPAVATRKDFDPSRMSASALERLKLEDGIRVHETAKVDLEVYAQQNGVPRVKPFMLVIAANTEHAGELVKLIESREFLAGRYKGRVIQVHSGQKGAEKDENVERLLAVERPDESTEIVVHVNMLKEGWDVTNLYTIVPLRAADSKTLVEQSIGRGLRLPYGKRTGVPAVDRLTIVAHDKFQEIVDEAKKEGFTFQKIHLGTDVAEMPPTAASYQTVAEVLLGIAPEATATARTTPVFNHALVAPEPRFKKPEETAVARHALTAIKKAIRDPVLVPGSPALLSDKVQKYLVDDVRKRMGGEQTSLYPILNDKDIVSLVREATSVFASHTIGIPRVSVVPRGDVRAGFREFRLDLSSVRLQPVSEEILVRHLNRNHAEVIGGRGGGPVEKRLEDYVVRGLVDFDDVSYDDQQDLLYGLGSQVVSRLRSYLKDDDEIRNVLLFHQKQLASLVHTQMQAHAWERATSYEVVVRQGFLDLRPQAFVVPAGETLRPFDKPIDNKLDIRNMIFGGFKKCMYPAQKFDSDVERRFAELLERDLSVEKWLKPGKSVFQIRYTSSNDYEPDFVLETKAEKLLCEPKRADDMKDPIVLEKARAAVEWCTHASAHEIAHNGKPWRYLLIPHDDIRHNTTIEGLLKSWEHRR